MKHVHHGSIQEASRIYLEQKKVAMRDVYNARKCQAPVAEASEALATSQITYVRTSSIVMRLWIHIVHCLALVFLVVSQSNIEAEVEKFFNNNDAGVSAHTNNWAVLVCASRYWFNYRVSAYSFTFSVTQ